MKDVLGFLAYLVFIIAIITMPHMVSWYLIGYGAILFAIWLES